MQIQPLPPYFLVRISKEQIRSRRGMIGSLHLHPSHVAMTRNMESGEIIGIGKKAHEYFPEAQVGQILLFHHFVMGEQDECDGEHLIHSDNEYNYYVVTAFEFNGKNSETYGVWDGQKVIPNKDYIFLYQPETPESDIDLEALGKEIGFTTHTPLTESKGGLLVFKEWEETRETKENKQKRLKKEVEDLSKSGNHKEHIQKGILEKEKEMSELSIEINKRRYIPFKVAFYNPEYLTHFGTRASIEPTENVYVLNIAANTTTEVNGIEYIVAKTQYAVAIN